ncbi:antitoxin Xre/MbcA/ParS toxin-binding domain-containing protein [Variovorax sp. GB1R11]|uniref:antitoxin Xre/MbcA/ParS toxin-binding domain-containing protein n=1 Tax=Variovorax sp. GB1R11 TaxID=3443741 RepID=UPI003F465021
MSDIQSSTRTIQHVLAAATAVSGGDLEAAILWYRNEPLALFDYRTAESLVAEGRAADVLDLLESFQAGFVG